MSDANDHDILLKLERDVSWVKEMLGNHLKHHWAITLGACTTTFGVIVTIIILLVKGR